MIGAFVIARRGLGFAMRTTTAVELSAGSTSSLLTEIRSAGPLVGGIGSVDGFCGESTRVLAPVTARIRWLPRRARAQRRRRRPEQFVGSSGSSERAGEVRRRRFLAWLREDACCLARLDQTAVEDEREQVGAAGLGRGCALRR